MSSSTIDKHVLVCCVAERQSWANPSLPELQIVDNWDPLKSQPYGTFEPQMKYNTVGNYGPMSTPTLYDESVEEPTSNNATVTDGIRLRH